MAQHANNIRRIILRVLLASLGLAALLGVLAVLLPMHDAMYRAIASAILTAVAAALLLPASSRIEQPSTRPAALAAVAFVVVLYVLILAFIWMVDRTYHWSIEANIGFTIGALLPTGLGAVASAALWSRYRPAAITGWAVSGSTFLIFLIAIWFEDWMQWPTSWKWWSIGWAIYLYGALLVMHTIALGSRRLLDWRWIGVLAVVPACLMAMTGIWLEMDEPSRILAWLSIAAVLVAHANVLTQINLPAGQRWLKHSTLGASATGLGLLSLGIAVTPDISQLNEMLLRLVGACLIVAGCATMACLVLLRLQQRGPGGQAVEQAEAFTHVSLTCPRCQLAQKLAVGASPCGRCGLMFHLRMEQPVCPACAYVLYGPCPASCPECGEAITPPGAM